MMRKTTATLGIFLLLVGMLVSCSSEDEPTGPDPETPFPHATPIPGTMTMDLSNLSQGSGVNPSGFCHALSALAVAWANANVAVRLAVPVAGFTAAVSQNPVYLGDDTWRWTANGGAGAGAWTAELEGTLLGVDEIGWAMRISGTPANLDRFLWFDGISNFAAGEGYWHYYDPNATQTTQAVVRCDWARPGTFGDDGSVAFEIVDPNHADHGDWLYYELAGTAAEVVHLNASESATTTIAWDTETGAGQTTNAAGETCCWDVAPGYETIACPGAPEPPFPHPLPTGNSMTMDLGHLSAGGLAAERGICHGLSSLAVSWLNLNVVVRLAIPFAAFSATVSETPVYLGDDTWRWTATGGSGAGAWTAELEAELPGDDQIHWSMRISGTQYGYDRLLWFDGVSDFVAGAGHWDYYDPEIPDTPTGIIRCDWTRLGTGGDDRTVVFEITDTDAPAVGDQLSYGLAGTGATVQFEDASESATTTTHWDTETGEGQTMNANGETCCWGVAPVYPDIDCP